LRRDWTRRLRKRGGRGVLDPDLYSFTIFIPSRMQRKAAKIAKDIPESHRIGGYFTNSPLPPFFHGS
jgi:hypothetical protein